MSTVDQQVAGDVPDPLSPTATDAIQAALAVLAQVQSVSDQVDQTGLSVQEYAAIAQAASAAAARLAANAYNRTTVNDANYQVLQTDVYVEVNPLTASRTITLPDPTQYYPGRPLTIADASGSCSPTRAINISPGTFPIVGWTSTPSLQSPGASAQLYATGNGQWALRS